MNITEINARMAELTTMENQTQQQILTLQANLNAIAGAKQDCQFWLAKLEETEKNAAQNESLEHNALTTVEKPKRGRKPKAT